MAKNIPIEKIIQIYEKKGCNITATCTALGISRKTFYEWKEKKKKKKLAEGLEAVAKEVFDALGLKHHARIDFRRDKNGNVYVI